MDLPERENVDIDDDRSIFPNITEILSHDVISQIYFVISDKAHGKKCIYNIKYNKIHGI